MTSAGPTIATLLLRVQGEYHEMPGLTLTEAQARRLWNLDGHTCSLVLTTLLEQRFLRRTANGTYVMTGGSNRQLTDALLFGPLLSIGRQKLGNVLAKPSQADLLFLKELCEAGKVRPMIDRRFPLSEVPAAVRYVEDGQARGKVVITIEHRHEPTHADVHELGPPRVALSE